MDMRELRLPNPIRPAFDKPTSDEHVIVNIGPSHPATHGTIQIVAELDGERITDVSFQGSGCAISVASASVAYTPAPCARAKPLRCWVSLRAIRNQC